MIPLEQLLTGSSADILSDATPASAHSACPRSLRLQQDLLQVRGATKLSA